MGERIEGKVAQIISEREVAFNIGSDHGVKEGMKFAILAKSPLPILDPDTGSELGSVDRTKVRVVASRVEDKWSIAETYEVYAVETGGLGPGGFWSVSQMFEPRRVEKRVQTLRLKDAAGPPPLPPEESFVEIGDRVLQLIE